jgi:hypothetical protein
MPPKKGSHQKYITAVEAFLVEADEWLKPVDGVWVHMAKDLAKDLDNNGINGTLLNQFSKVITRLESRKPEPPKAQPELPPVERDQLDLFLESHGR